MSKFDDFVEHVSPWLIPAILVAFLVGRVVAQAFEPKKLIRIFPQTTRVMQVPSEHDSVQGQVPDEPKAEDAPSPEDVPPAESGPPAGDGPAIGDADARRSPPAGSTLEVVAGGQALLDWEPVQAATVWVRLVSANGNTYLVGSGRTSSEGRFDISGQVETVDSSPQVEMVIDAKKRQTQTDEDEKEAIVGQTSVRLGSGLKQHRVQASLWAVLGLPAVFFLSLWVAFLETQPGFGRRLKYLAALTLAFMFTACMIFGVALGLSSVKDLEGAGEVLTLGYGFLFRGTYVNGGTHEWIYSFTSPYKGDSNITEALATGFGAPLWVILLSVIGAAVATVSLLVVATKNPPDTARARGAKEFRARIEQIVEHQFFILFAPLGSIFVYQLLVAADGANKAVTVALASLGAGPVLNYLLAQAIEKARGVISAH